MVPCGLNLALTTSPSWPESLLMSRPVAASHTHAVRSLPAVTTNLPSGLNAASLMNSEWPVSVDTFWPLSRSQMEAVWRLNVTRNLPSGLNEGCDELTICAIRLPVSASQISTFDMLLSVTKNRPSAL